MRHGFPLHMIYSGEIVKREREDRGGELAHGIGRNPIKRALTLFIAKRTLGGTSLTGLPERKGNGFIATAAASNFLLLLALFLGSWVSD